MPSKTLCMYALALLPRVLHYVCTMQGQSFLLALLHLRSPPVLQWQSLTAVWRSFLLGADHPEGLFQVHIYLPTRLRPLKFCLPSSTPVCSQLSFLPTIIGHAQVSIFGQDFVGMSSSLRGRRHEDCEFETNLGYVIKHLCQMDRQADNIFSIIILSLFSGESNVKLL